MTEYIDFDLQLSKYDDGHFTAIVNRVIPGTKSPSRAEITTPIHFDIVALDAAKGDPVEYGRVLTRQLFASADLRSELARAREAAAAEEHRAVRFRLSLSNTAPQLHALRWETLRDPENEDAPLLTNENIVFSRHVYTARGKPVRDEPPADLKALVAIASPADLAQVKKAGMLPLAPIDYEEEKTAAAERLQGFGLTYLAGPGAATIDNLFDALRDTDYDVLYLVCHGAPSEKPRLVLENESGNRELIDAASVVQRMNDLTNPPPLVVLASCRSGGATYASSGESVSRLGPLLAVECGIPVVLAMQGDVTIESASHFLSTFFANFRKDGDVDHAVTVARGAIRDRVDAWMPVLYMRLSDGRLWSTERRDTARRSFDKWDSLLTDMSRGHCTPVIGFGVYEEMFGDATMLARQWGETYRYPFHDHDQLTEIAQFLAINQNLRFPRQELIDHFRRQVLRRYGDRIDTKNIDRMSTDELIEKAWRAAAGPRDPHRILANLPCSLYVTANASTLLERALADTLGFAPYSGICRWNEKTKNAGTMPADLDVAKPLVYHLFGRLDDLNSIVVTEDNYFDYLYATGANANEPSPMVRGASNNSSVMLLGFRITDWTLRVLFRTMMKDRSADYTNVAVQVDPNQPGVSDADRVYAYLDDYFGQQNMTIIRGNVADFTNELTDRWKQKFGEDLTAKRAEVRPT
ncbi:MAG TPA: CHAT domain-containing protein [Thermoanaerobaculia bacterium]|nr:CHAT domain-containing protein [Thermoanaerobaculia bacterium]